MCGYDFIEDRPHDGRKCRALCILEEFTRRSLAIVVRRRFTAHHVVEILAQFMIVNGVPGREAPLCSGLPSPST